MDKLTHDHDFELSAKVTNVIIAIGVAAYVAFIMYLEANHLA